MNHVIQNSKCLACGSDNLHMALDLGMQPLANSYKETSESPDERYPLAVNLCNLCYHLQLSHVVDPTIIYRNYLYATGTNQTIKDYSKWFADFCLELKPNTRAVLDIGCNDGTQLDYFKAKGVDTHGIDPAENLHSRSKNNHSVICDFFGSAAVYRLKSHAYDIITAQNVCAHSPDPYTFMSCCAELMSDDTLLVIQTSQADMILNNEFDTIYHEHVNFFNANSMKCLADRTGLHLIDVIKTPIHGNSYVFILSKKLQNQKRLQNIIAMESAQGLMALETYEKWSHAINKNMDSLMAMLDQYRKQGYVLVGYGAAAKGNTLLNFGDIKLDFIIDDNPSKQGKFTPGMSCVIVGIDHLDEYDTDDRLVFVPLAWNFFREIKSKISVKRNNGNDRFVRYFPEVTVA